MNNTLYIRTQVCDEWDNEIDTIAAAVLLDVNSCSDERAVVRIGEDFWLYRGGSMRPMTRIEVDVLYPPTTIKYLTFTEKGEYFE